MKMRKKAIIKSNSTKIAFLVILITGICLLQTEECSAAFNLTVSPYDGGLDLRFGHVQSGVRASKEVSMRITSDIGKQYRVVQTYSTLTNSRGATIPAKAFVVYTLRSSNSTGTLRYDFESWVSSGPMDIYTSDRTGTGDSFVVVYGLNVPPNQVPGLYRGRLIYSLEPIGSPSQNPITKTLDIIVEVDATANFEVITSSGNNVLQLKSSEDAASSTQEVQIKINGRLGSQYRIIQKLSNPPRDASGQPLPDEAVMMSVRGSTKGKSGTGNFIPLPTSDFVLYTSDAQGNTDEIIITYVLNDTGLTAGAYKGSLTYVLESQIPISKGNVLEILQLDVEIKPIFNLSVTTDNSGRILFKDLKPGRPPQISTSYIEIQTNIGKPYQVVQKVSDLLTNKEGHAIPSGFFKLKTKSEDSSEGVGYAREVPVEGDQMVLFTSKDGKPAKFQVIYKLDIPMNVHAGSYATGITYSLLEI